MKNGLVKDCEMDTQFLLQNKKNLQFTAMLQSFGPLTMSKCFMSAMCYWLLWGPLCEQQGVPAAVRACVHLIVLL